MVLTLLLTFHIPDDFAEAVTFNASIKTSSTLFTLFLYFLVNSIAWKCVLPLLAKAASRVKHQLNTKCLDQGLYPNVKMKIKSSGKPDIEARSTQKHPQHSFILIWCWEKHRQLAHEINWQYLFWWDYLSSRKHWTEIDSAANPDRASFESNQILNMEGDEKIENKWVWTSTSRRFHATES